MKLTIGESLLIVSTTILGTLLFLVVIANGARLLQWNTLLGALIIIAGYGILLCVSQLNTQLVIRLRQRRRS